MNLVDVTQKNIERLNGITLSYAAWDAILVEDGRERAETTITRNDITIHLPSATLPQSAVTFHDDHIPAAALFRYLELVEEISHFTLAAWKLERDIPFTPLELETQAHFDKYMLGHTILSKRFPGLPGQFLDYALKAVLFHLPQTVDQPTLYATADRYGYHYIDAFRRGKVSLERHRQLYRIPAPEKIKAFHHL